MYFLHHDRIEFSKNEKEYVYLNDVAIYSYKF